MMRLTLLFSLAFTFACSSPSNKDSELPTKRKTATDVMTDKSGFPEVMLCMQPMNDCLRLTKAGEFQGSEEGKGGPWQTMGRFDAERKFYDEDGKHQGTWNQDGSIVSADGDKHGTIAEDGTVTIEGESVSLSTLPEGVELTGCDGNEGYCGLLLAMAMAASKDSGDESHKDVKPDPTKQPDPASKGP